MSRFAIVGAGISGLACARELKERGHAAVVFEKSRSFGGRCATRLWEESIVDHGAQYFTARDAAFKAELERRCSGRIRRIEAPVLDLSGSVIAESSPRLYHADGNNRLGKAMADGIEVRREMLLPPDSLKHFEGELSGETFAAVGCTVPYPQACALLGHDAPAGCYTRCLTAFYCYEGDWAGNSRDRYAISDLSGPLAWSACENHKPGRIADGRTVFVAQASPGFSEEFFEAPPEDWTERLRPLLEDRWRLCDSARGSWFAHRWGFARRVQPIEPPPLPPRVRLAGDSLVKSRIESAWMSGRQLAGRLVAET